MRAWLILIAVWSFAVRAQQQGEPEFTLPPFPPSSEPEAPAETPRLAPPAPTWSRLGAEASLLVTVLTNYFVGGELSLFLTLVGTPAHSDAIPGEVEGWLLQAGLEAGYGRAGGPACDGGVACASRAFGGVLLKGGWGRGLPRVVDGVARPQTMYFAEGEVLLSHFEIPSAPLAPGLRTWELLMRLRVGLHFSAEGSRASSTGVAFIPALVLEGIPVSSGTQGFSLGGSLGVGF